MTQKGKTLLQRDNMNERQRHKKEMLYERGGVILLQERGIA